MTPREAAIVTAYTGIVLGDFPTFHNYVEEVMGRPVWTHEMADPEVAEQIKQAAKSDFMAIEVTA